MAKANGKDREKSLRLLNSQHHQESQLPRRPKPSTWGEFTWHDQAILSDPFLLADSLCGIFPSPLDGPRWGPRSNHCCRRLYQMEATVPVPCPPAVTPTRRAPPSLALRPSFGGPERAPKISSRLLPMIGSLPLAVLVLFGTPASGHRAMARPLPSEDGRGKRLDVSEREVCGFFSKNGRGEITGAGLWRRVEVLTHQSKQVDVTSHPHPHDPLPPGRRL
jgi:hypothetical protein